MTAADLARTYSAGVHVGVLAQRAGKEVLLYEARRIWTWQGRNTGHRCSGGTTK